MPARYSRPKRAHPRQRAGNVPGTDHYNVKTIHDYKFMRNLGNEDSRPLSLYFLVEWDGYSMDHATWEPADNLMDSWNLVVDYMKEQGKRVVFETKEVTDL